MKIKTKYFNMLKKILLLLTASSAIVATMQSHAVEIPPEIGGQRFSMPSVPGFAEAGTNPALIRLARSLIEPNAKLVSALFRKENPDKYILVKTPKAIEMSTLSISEFRSIKDSMKRSTLNMSKFADVANTQAKQSAQDVNDATGHNFKDMAFGAPSIIELERDDEYGFGYTAITKIKGNIDGQNVAWNSLMCAHALKLKGKLLIVHVFSVHRSQADVDWVRNTCRTFVTGLVAAN